MTGYFIFSIFAGVAGLFLLVWWLAGTGFGIKALEGAQVRRNEMPDFFPFAVLLGWVFLAFAGSSVAESLTSEMLDWRQKFAMYFSYVLIEMAAVVFIVLSVKKYFEGGLAGFGIRVKGIFQDIAAAAGSFVAVWPLVFISLNLVYYVGVFFVGNQFEMEKNPGLEVILEYNQLGLRILMIFFATILTPIFEELVFRGLLQSYLRNLEYGPWVSIFIVSAIFAAIHPLMHFPAIFVLSCAMGYAYERSGSILRSIFIHCFFNSSQIAFALLVQS